MSARVAGDQVDALARAFLDLAAPATNMADLTLERLITDPDLGAFNASPVQLACIRAADGVPLDDILPPDRMLYHLGCERLPSGRPRLVILRTGVRAGKSLIAAMALLLSILTCRFRRPPEPHERPAVDGLVGVRPGEFVRALIVAPVMELSKAVLSHLVGTMQASPVLSKLLAKDPGAESCVIKRPDGHEVTVKLVAASSGGTNLRSTWLAGVVFDEADFHDDEDGAVNLNDQIRAAMTRLLDGAQAWVPSSPWADTGPFHEKFTEAFGKPGQTLAFHSDSRSMNPTLNRADEEAERARDPENAAREYDAVPLASGSLLFFPPDAIAKSVNKNRERVLEPIRGVRHYAGGDLGFRKNSSALAIARSREKKIELAYHEEVRPQPGASLKPSDVCAGFAAQTSRYGAVSVRGDLHYADTAREEFAKEQRDDAGLVIYDGRVWYDEWNPSQENQADAFTEFRRRMQEGLVDLPDEPRLIGQLKGVTKRALPGGRIQVVLPKQGRSHGDVLMAVVLACVQVPISEPLPLPPHPPPRAPMRFSSGASDW